ncbi:hypothetical protein D3C85_1137400 [compost metagenome]
MPNSTNCSVIPVEDFSAVLPPPNFFSPIWIIPFKNVPLVNTTAVLSISIPKDVLTPYTVLSFTSKPTTLSCQISRFFVLSKAKRHSSAKRILSIWALGLHIAGPLDLLSILNCMVDLSDIIPE